MSLDRLIELNKQVQIHLAVLKEEATCLMLFELEQLEKLNNQLAHQIYLHQKLREAYTKTTTKTAEFGGVSECECAETIISKTQCY